MKKFFASLMLTLLAAPAFAQFSSGGFTLDEDNVYYGIRIGFTSASISGDTDEGYDLDLDSKMGLELGGVIGLRVSPTFPLFLESGLYYAERGAKKGNLKVGYNNLEIPLLIKYGVKVGDDMAVLPFFGPVFSYAFGGKTQWTDEDGKHKVGTFDEKKAATGGLRRANFGLKLGCGFEFNMLYAEVGYQFGVSDIAKYDDITAHSNAFFANIGINF